MLHEIPRDVIFKDFKIILGLTKIIHVDSKNLRIFARNDEGLGVAIISQNDLREFLEELHAEKAINFNLPSFDEIIHDMPVFLRSKRYKHAYRAWDLYIAFTVYKVNNLSPEIYISKDGLLILYDKDSEICTLICPIRF